MKVTKAQAAALQADLDSRGYRRPGGDPYTDLSDVIGMIGVAGVGIVAMACWLIGTVAMFNVVGG